MFISNHLNVQKMVFKLKIKYYQRKLKTDKSTILKVYLFKGSEWWQSGVCVCVCVCVCVSVRLCVRVFMFLIPSTVRGRRNKIGTKQVLGNMVIQRCVCVCVCVCVCARAQTLVTATFWDMRTHRTQGLWLVGLYSIVHHRSKTLPGEQELFSNSKQKDAL